MSWILSQTQINIFLNKNVYKHVNTKKLWQNVNAACHIFQLECAQEIKSAVFHQLWSVFILVYLILTSLNVTVREVVYHWKKTGNVGFVRLNPKYIILAMRMI